MFAFLVAARFAAPMVSLPPGAFRSETQPTFETRLSLNPIPRNNSPGTAFAARSIAAPFVPRAVDSSRAMLSIAAIHAAVP